MRMCPGEHTSAVSLGEMAPQTGAGPNQGPLPCMAINSSATETTPLAHNTIAQVNQWTVSYVAVAAY